MHRELAGLGTSHPTRCGDAQGITLFILASRSSVKRKFWLAGHPEMSQPLGATRAEHPGKPFLGCLTPTLASCCLSSRQKSPRQMPFQGGAVATGSACLY